MNSMNIHDKRLKLIHYSIYPNWVTIACGRNHDVINFTDNPKKVTCKRCHAILVRQAKLLTKEEVKHE